MESLLDYGGTLFDLQKENKELYQMVLNKYYSGAEYNNIWVLENIHHLCDKQSEDEEYINSEIYYIMSKLYDMCDWILLWYENDYTELMEIQTKESFLDYIKSCVGNTSCELYARVIKL